MQQQQQQTIEFDPSFSYYSSDSITSTAIAKVIREEQEDIKKARLHDDFEFSFVLLDEEVSVKETDSRGWSVFKRDLLVNEEVNRQIKATGETKSPPSGTYCVWSPKADSGSSQCIIKCKKSSYTESTGSGSKRWIFRYLLQRSKSEGKDPMVVLTQKKVDSPKQKRNSGEVSSIGGRWKVQARVHEQFYVQRRAENEVVMRKSYLPCRKDLVGLFGNVNGMRKLLPF